MGSQLDLAALEDCLKTLNHLFIDINRLKAEAGYEAKRGGYGDVQVSRLDSGTAGSKLVAAKTIYLKARHKEPERLAFRLTRELKVWARLHHPHVLPVLGYYLDKDYRIAVLMSEYMIHGDLKDYIEQEKPFWDTRLYLIRDTTAGLAYLHGQDPPIRHGDLKTVGCLAVPRLSLALKLQFTKGNVLINAKRRAILADFGLSKAMEEGPTGLTTSDGLKGTLRYYSPELIRDTDACHSLPSDIWAWACLALEVLADTIPYAEKKSEHSIILALMNNEPPSDTISLPIPVPAVKHLLARCWTVQPNERPSVEHCLSTIAAELSALQMTSVVGGDPYQRSNLGSFNFDEDYLSNRQLNTPNAVSLVNSTPNTVVPSLQGGLSAPLDPAAAFGGVGRGMSAEAHLEQLAANVRSSTTTTTSDRAKQVFVKAWLSANHAPDPDGSVPRQCLYNSYRQVCDTYNIPHINTATFGKAIRLCFPNIKIRRLSVRGNSKYHYCGIRPATVAEAQFLPDFVRRTTNHAAIAASSRRAAVQPQGGNGSDEGDDKDSEVRSSRAGSIADSESSSVPPTSLEFGDTHSRFPASLAFSNAPYPLTLGRRFKSPTFSSMLGDDKMPTTNTLLSAHQAASLNGRTANNRLTYSQSHAQIRARRGIGSTDSQVSASNAAPGSRAGTSSGFAASSTASVSVRSLPNFPSINEALSIESNPPANADGSAGDSNASAGSPSFQNGGGSPQHQAAIKAWRWFEDHLDGLLESVRGWRFDQFEIHVRTFWEGLSGDYREVVHAPAVAGLVVRADAVVYDEILEILRTQMLATIPPHSLASLRQLAEKMEKILLLALEGYGNTFVEPKVELGARFGHLVLRFLDMYQVAQTLTPVLSNAQQLADMRHAWSEVDFESVQNQSDLVCDCPPEDLQQLLKVNFVAVLDGLVANAQIGGLVASGEPVWDIMNWADVCFEWLMGRASGGADGEEKSTMSSRSVLIRWEYVTGQVMRDLTIRRDPSFGAFQILKLLVDECIALNALRSLALPTKSATQKDTGIAASPHRAAAQRGNGIDKQGDKDSEVPSSSARGRVDSASSRVPTTTTFGFGDTHSNSPAPLAPSNASHYLTLGGGLKSPTLYSMLGDDKTPTTNTLLSAQQTASLNGRTANNGLTYGMSDARIRSRRGIRSTDSQVSASNAAPGSRLGTSSGFTAGSAAPASVKSLPNFPSINEALDIDSKSSANANGSAGSPSSQNGGSPHHQAVIEAWRGLEDHLDGLLESVRSWRFDQFEIHVRTFWASLSGDYREVVHAPAVAGLVVRADAVVYDEILEILRTQMFATIRPHSLTSLRQLAENMKKNLLLALEGYGNTFAEPKVELGARFGHLVLRFLDMYQTTQALTSVLSNAHQVAGMRHAWSEVDFESVRNQSALVCNCRHEDLQQLLEVNFVAVLDGLFANAELGLVGSTEPVRDIMDWADMCCERLMDRASGGADGDKKPTISPRSGLIRWGYVTSQVMRDLTIRSDPSFGAFQILKLLIDDCIAFNILRSAVLNRLGASCRGTSDEAGYLVGDDPSTQGAHHHPLAHSTTFDAPFSHGNVESGSFTGYGGSFDMSFLDGAHDVPVKQAHFIAATGVGGSEAGESPVPGRGGSDESVDVKDL